jgi:hypothetical protein
LRAREKQEKILFDGLEASIKWSRRRRTIGLTVTGEGKVVVAAPQGTPQARIIQALTRHRDWIARKVEERQESWAKLQEGAVFFQGQAYRLYLDPAAPALVALGAGEVRVKAAAAVPAWPLLRAWYRGEAELLIRERVTHYAREMVVQEHRVELREWKRRWGECQPQEALRFNWRLILLPPEILDYVVVHELTHHQEPGHAARFWQRVEQVLPDYAERRQWLNRYGTPFLLWRLDGGE